MGRCPQRYRKRGFTLIELLVSSVLIGLGLIALSQLYLAAMHTYEKSRNLSIATQRAQRELEKVQSLGYSKLKYAGENAYPPPYYSIDLSNSEVDFTVDELPNGRGNISWDYYFSGDTSGYEHMLKVTIDINWDGAPVSQSFVRVETLLTRGLK